jgi:hypothetical protein
MTIQVALLNVLPTVVQFELMGGGPSLAQRRHLPDPGLWAGAMFAWFFLSALYLQ